MFPSSAERAVEKAFTALALSNDTPLTNTDIKKLIARSLFEFVQSSDFVREVSKELAEKARSDAAGRGIR